MSPVNSRDGKIIYPGEKILRLKKSRIPGMKISRAKKSMVIIFLKKRKNTKFFEINYKDIYKKSIFMQYFWPKNCVEDCSRIRDNKYVLQKISVPYFPLITGKRHFWPTCFLTPRLSAWPFKSLAWVFDSKFDHKLFSSLKIT